MFNRAGIAPRAAIQSDGPEGRPEGPSYGLGYSYSSSSSWFFPVGKNKSRVLWIS